MENRGNKKTLVRNVLIIAGAYLAPLALTNAVWWRISFLFRGYSADGGAFNDLIIFFLAALPMIISALAAGILSGYALETRRSLAWAVFLGVLVFFIGFFTFRWQGPMNLNMLFTQVLHGLIPGLCAVFSYGLLRKMTKKP
jgi:hypothetical protein